MRVSVCILSHYIDNEVCVKMDYVRALSTPLSPSVLARFGGTTSSATSGGLSTAFEPMAHKLSLHDKLFWGYKQYWYVRVCVVTKCTCLMEHWYVCLHTCVLLVASAVGAMRAKVCDFL